MSMTVVQSLQHQQQQQQQYHHHQQNPPRSQLSPTTTNLHSSVVAEAPSASVSPHLRHAHHHQQHSNLGNFSISSSFPKQLKSSLMHDLTSNNSSSSSSITSGRYGDSQSSNSNLSLLSNLISSPSSSSSNFTRLWTEGDNSTSTLIENNFTLNLPSNSTGMLFNELILNRSGDGASFKDNYSRGESGNSSSFPGVALPFNLSMSEMNQIHSLSTNSSSMYMLNSSEHLGEESGQEIAQNVTSSAPQEAMSFVYSIIVPVMIVFCVLTCLVNLIIVLSARWCRKPMSPTLYFSISLALADAYASFVLGTGLFVNSFLPRNYKIELDSCISLIIEAFRSGGILVIVCHLLALGINHWIGIVRPLHYAATMTRRTAWIVIILSWICPILMIFCYYSLITEQGFLDESCQNNNFLRRSTYRGFFAACFFAPLLLMSFIYIHIFLIVRNHHSHRLRYQTCHQLRRNVKAVLTTVLILGTYVIGWMPAILFSIIACDDCLIKLEEVPLEIMYAVSITVNTLIILKTLVDPIIYAARMSDIQLSLKKMKYDFLQRFCKCCVNATPPVENDRGFSKFNRSLYESKSVRMSSVGSSSSSRRAAAAAAANLMNGSPGYPSNHHSLGAGSFNNSINYKNHNGNNSSSHIYNNHHQSNPKTQLLHASTNFEMTEMR